MKFEFYRDKRVFVTGHTGFKGSWLCKILINAGARVTGYSLTPPTEPNLFTLCQLEDKMDSIMGDIRDYEKLSTAFEKAKPEIVIHMAAQPIVRESYINPHCTYETNVMGTVNILECVRMNKHVKSFLNVTTDKVYKNNEWEWGYRENEPLDGFDPYSNSKSCSELVTHSYKSSFFSDCSVAISTARSGNVIGGGDFAIDRIIPDCIRASEAMKTIIVRNPNSTRPYQHVLEPITVYLMIAEKQFNENNYAGYYNIGPDEYDCITTGTLVDIYCKKWGNGQTWENQDIGGPHEASFLKLDCSKLKSVFNWRPRWNIEVAVDKTVEWTKIYFDKGNISQIMDKQIDEFMIKE